SYETQYDSPHSYLFYAGAVRWGSWVFGAGYSNPFYNDYTYINPLSGIAIERLEIGLKSYDAMIARRFGKYLAVGVAAHQETTYQAYRNSSIPGSVAVGGISTKATATSYSFGMAIRDEAWGVGVSYFPERKIVVDKSGDDSLEAFNTVVFRDVVVPGKTSYGIFARPWERLLLAFDIDRYSMVSNAIYVSSVTTSYSWLKSEPFQIMHGGFELTALADKWWELLLRGGGYREPTRFQDGRDRDHITYGAEVRIGPLVYSYGADQAQGFNNSSHGLSFSLDGL
ncbi:MAG: hypothetical protein AAB250_00490, partial [Bdellovibrionota bacterium]